MTELQDNNILVIGGCGYFGHRIIRWLVFEEHVPASRITVIDQATPTSDRLVTDVKYLEADITDRSVILDIFHTSKPGIVVHTASPRYHIGDLDVFMLHNVEGTRNLLDAAVAEPSTHVFLYTSSSSVVHDYVSNLENADESYPLLFIPQQRQPYQHSKAVAEQLALSYNRKREDFVVAAIRPSAMFGPGERTMIPAMVERAKKGTLRYQIGDGTNLADVTYVDNTVFGLILTVRALLKALASADVPETKRVEGEAFVFTNDVHANFWDFARQVGAAAGYPTKDVVAIPKALGLAVASTIEWAVWVFSFGTRTANIKRIDLHYSTITRTFDISKAKDRLGYRPRFSLEEGIELAVAPFKEVKKSA